MPPVHEPSDSGAFDTIGLCMPDVAAVRAWGKRHIIHAMIDRGFPRDVVYTEATRASIQWLCLNRSALLRAIWDDMEP